MRKHALIAKNGDKIADARGQRGERTRGHRVLLASAAAACARVLCVVEHGQQAVLLQRGGDQLVRPREGVLVRDERGRVKVGRRQRAERRDNGAGRLQFAICGKGRKMYTHE